MADYLSKIVKQRVDIAKRFAPLAYDFFKSFYDQVYKDSDSAANKAAALAELEREFIISFGAYCDFWASKIWRKCRDTKQLIVQLSALDDSQITAICNNFYSTASHLKWLDNWLATRVDSFELPGIGTIGTMGTNNLVLIIHRDELEKWANCFDWSEPEPTTSLQPNPTDYTRLKQLQDEVQRLKDRPAMSCYACEELNLKLADELDSVKRWEAKDGAETVAWNAWVEAWCVGQGIDSFDLITLGKTPEECEEIALKMEAIRIKFDEWWLPNASFQ